MWDFTEKSRGRVASGTGAKPTTAGADVPTVWCRAARDSGRALDPWREPASTHAGSDPTPTVPAREFGARGRYRPGVQDALELRAFGHVVVPIAVVIAMGVARIVSVLGDYIRHHDRVEFALGHSLWSIVVFLLQVGLWWTVWSLRRVEAAD